MQIQNPTASLIAKTVITQKSYIGDGATSTIILIGEALRNIEKYLEKGVHPQVLCDGIDLTRMEIEKWLPTKVIEKTLDRKTLLNCAKTVIETKIKKNLCNKFANIAVDAILTICNEGKIMDLERIEMLQINTRTESDSKWIRGIVLDHGARHPDMPKIIHNAFILLCNVNLEYERPTTNSTINYDSIEDREKISLNERELIDKTLDRKTLLNCAKTVIETKIKKNLCNKFANIAVDAILTICNEGKIMDLERIEMLQINTRTESDSKWIRGIVLDHGARHPDMPKIIHNAFILLCNINLEYERPTTNSTINYDSIEDREKISLNERELIDKRVKNIIQLKRSVCMGKNRGFVLINQKGIDPISLDLLSKEGILGIRRAKRKNLERIALLCNCIPINSIHNLNSNVLGFSGIVYEQIIGEEKYTFFENVSNPFSGTIIVKGRSSFIRKQIETSIYNAIKTLKLGIQDRGFLRGAGGIELMLQQHLLTFSTKIPGKKKYGVRAVANAIASIPKTLFENSGLKIDNLSKCIKVYQEELIMKNTINLDSYSTKKHIFTTVCFLLIQLLLIDDIYFGRGLA